jgi:hypothetical protein
MLFISGQASIFVELVPKLVHCVWYPESVVSVYGICMQFVDTGCFAVLS